MMRRINAARLLLLFAVFLTCMIVDVPVTAQPAEELFNSAVELTGNDYFQVRDVFLQSPDTDLLTDKLRNGTPPEWIQATILLGWLENEARYRELINVRTTTTRALQSHYPWARRELLDRDIAPLLIEILVKGGQHENAKSDAAMSLQKMLRSGMTLDSRLFTIPFRDQDESTRQLLASVVSELPATGNEQVFEELNAIFRAEQDVHTNRFVLSAMIRQLDALPEQKKSELVAELDDQAQIKQFGQRTVYSAIADIGGAEAEKVLLDHFDQTWDSEDAVQQRDAVSMLLKVHGDESLKRLLTVARDTEAPEHLRKIVHNGLGSMPYDDEIKAHLLNVLQDAELSAGERTEAVTALTKIQGALNLQGLETDDITSAIEEVLDEVRQEDDDGDDEKDLTFEKTLEQSWESGLRIDR